MTCCRDVSPSPPPGTPVAERQLTARGRGDRAVCTAASSGRPRRDVRCSPFGGGPALIAFNPDYVLDGLKNAEREVVRLEFNDKSSPGKFTLGESYIYIVMPITVDD